MQKQTDYNGIDYGLGQTNIDKETGIRFGVIPMTKVLQAWCDRANTNYKYHCTNCYIELANDLIESLFSGCKENCRDCETPLTSSDYEETDPYSFTYTEKGYQAEQTAEGMDIFITKSPYYTLCQYCSPCAPGAGYLVNEGTVKAYCFGHDWFASEHAPYQLYSVETGKEMTV